MSPHTPRPLILTTLLAALCACASNQAYRHDLSASCIANQATDCPAAAVQRHAPQQADEYYLGFVEFDDQGQLRDRKQLQAVLDTFYPIAGREDVLIVAFAHGWHHSARPGDNNIDAFRQLLSKLARMESQGNRRKVLGVYLGWRGDSLTVPVVKDVTFWERKNTAHKVGQNGVTEVLLRLEEIVNVKAGTEAGKEPKPLNSRLAVIGHSFGGAVVFTALQQILADRFVDSRRGQTVVGDANGFGDLVVLVNPAFEALRYATLYDMSQDLCRRYWDSQTPKLAILTSEADQATGMAFPAGRFFSTLFETHGTLARTACTANGPQPLAIKEGEADRSAVGHFQPYATHKLRPIAGQPAMLTAMADFERLREQWMRQTPGAKLEFDGLQLAHLDKTRPLNPYLNIRVDPALIPNHNDIWGDGVLNFLRDLIAISTMPVGAAKPASP
jgi:hypothetical protein